MAVSSRSLPSETELTELVAEAQRGSSAALDRLLTAVRPWLLRFFGQAAHLEGDAEDCTQQTLVILARVIARRVDPIQPERVRGFLLRVAANLVVRHHHTRRWARRATPIDATIIADQRMGADDRASQHDLTERVLAAGAAHLDPASRAVLYHRADGWSTTEIAEFLHCSPEAVRTRGSRAARTLRDQLTKPTSAPAPTSDGIPVDGADGSASPAPRTRETP